MPRTTHHPRQRQARETVPDVPNFSWADYGMRAGLPRILSISSTAAACRHRPSFNAGVIDAYPEAAEAMMRDAGWNSSATACIRRR